MIEQAHPDYNADTERLRVALRVANARIAEMEAQINAQRAELDKIDIGEQISQLQNAISAILGRALAGYTDDYKHVVDGRTSIQWGEVEQAMYAAIDTALRTDGAAGVLE